MSYDKYPYELEPLPYAYDALEPYISAEIMHYHHDKHLGAYVNNLNKALEPYPKLQEMPLAALLAKPYAIPKTARNAVLRNGGGVFNHAMFFSQLRPPRDLETAENNNKVYSFFGSAAALKKAISDAALSVFGSGYAWLVRTPRSELAIIETANQETPLSLGYEPLLLIDVWEHAYYLQYKNLRADYVNNIWNVMDLPTNI